MSAFILAGVMSEALAEGILFPKRLNGKYGFINISGKCGRIKRSVNMVLELRYVNLQW